MNRTWSSRVPDAIDALVTRMRAVTHNTELTIRDGPWVEGGTDPQVIVIGFNGFRADYLRPTGATSEDFGTAAVSVSGASDGLGAGIRETFTISCASIVRTGDTKAIAVARRQSYNNVKVVGAVLVEPPLWLGGTVMRAVLGTSHSLDYVHDRRGLLVFPPFMIGSEAQARHLCPGKKCLRHARTRAALP